MLSPLHKLLQKGVKFSWSAECEQAFQRVKDSLASSPVLMHYSNDLPVVLEVDASPYGVGGCLFHITEGGQKKPIYFVSRALTSAEKNYSQIDREALAIVFAIKRLHQFLYGRHFVLRTDHKPLLRIFGEHTGVGGTVVARLQRWALFLASFDYSIEYVKGADNVTADCLSRLPQPLSQAEEEILIHAMNEFTADPCGDIPISSTDVAKASADDDVLSVVIRYVRFGWPSIVSDEVIPYRRIKDELSIDQGCLMWHDRVVIPVVFRSSLLKELHSVHLGVNRMKAVARSFFYWPNLSEDIASTCSSCDICQQNASLPAKEPVHPWVYPSRPFERVHLDFAEFEHRFYLVFVDAYSKWIEVSDLGRDMSTSKTIHCLLEIISRFGIPHMFVTDNGPQFTSGEFALFCGQNGIVHKRTPPYHPASNGQAERIVQELKKSLRARPPSVSIHVQLCRFLSSYRSTPQTSTGSSPCSLLFKFCPTTRFSLLQPSFSSSMSSQQKLPDSPSRGFKVGELVWVLNPPTQRPKWVKGTIVIRAGPLTYTVSVNGRHRSVHVEHLRSCSSPHNPDTSPSPSVDLPAVSPQPVFAPLPPLPQSQRESIPPQSQRPSSNSSQPVSPTVSIPVSSSVSPAIASENSQPSVSVSSPTIVPSTPSRFSERSSRVGRAPKRLIEEI